LDEFSTVYQYAVEAVYRKLRSLYRNDHFGGVTVTLTDYFRALLPVTDVKIDNDHCDDGHHKNSAHDVSKKQLFALFYKTHGRNKCRSGIYLPYPAKTTIHEHGQRGSSHDHCLLLTAIPSYMFKYLMKGPGRVVAGVRDVIRDDSRRIGA
jgi:hypothetical protein